MVSYLACMSSVLFPISKVVLCIVLLMVVIGQTNVSTPIKTLALITVNMNCM